MKAAKRLFVFIILISLAFGNAPFAHAATSATASATASAGSSTGSSKGLPAGVRRGERKVFYYLHDHLGGISAVTDEEGNVVERRDYLPYGDERLIEELDLNEDDLATLKDKTDYGFTGKEKDPESELYYYGRRYYDPMLGRFTSMDPLILEEAVTDQRKLQDLLKNPQMLNGYSYGLNNPLFYLDLFGESPYTEKWRGYGQMIDGVIEHVGGMVIMYYSKGQLTSPGLYFGADQMIKGAFDIGIGAPRVASGKNISYPAPVAKAGDAVDRTISAHYKTENAFTKYLKKLSNLNGYEKGLEAIGTMIENKITLKELFNSVKKVFSEEAKKLYPNSRTENKNIRTENQSHQSTNNWCTDSWCQNAKGKSKNSSNHSR